MFIWINLGREEALVACVAKKTENVNTLENVF